MNSRKSRDNCTANRQRMQSNVNGIIENVITERYVKLQAALDQIVQTLIAKYEPEKIIVFGSMATGNVHEWSDIDLVVVKDTSVPFVKRGVEIALMCRADVAVDYLVYTPAEFAKMIADDNIFIVDEVLSKGKVLYEREPATTLA